MNVRNYIWLESDRDRRPVWLETNKSWKSDAHIAYRSESNWGAHEVSNYAVIYQREEVFDLMQGDDCSYFAATEPFDGH